MKDRNASILLTSAAVVHSCTTSFNKFWTQVLHRFKSCSRCVGDSQWWGSLTMVPAGNKAKLLLLVHHTTTTIHHHYQVMFTSCLYLGQRKEEDWCKMNVKAEGNSLRWYVNFSETATQYLLKIWHSQKTLRNRMMGKDQASRKEKQCMGNTSEK